MNDQPSDPNASDSSHEEQLNRLISEYLDNSLESNLQKRQQLLESNPDFATELRQFFELHDRLQKVAKQDSLAQLSRSSPPSTLPLGKKRSNPKQLFANDEAFGDYKIEELIARGGMGAVYRAKQTSLNRVVALKMILAGELANEDEIRRFQIEAKAAANLEHPNIVPIFEVGRYKEHHYFSMGLVEGPSLADLIAESQLPPYEAAELTMKIAEAVAYAHRHGVIHRDLKPANVLLTAKKIDEQLESVTESEKSKMTLEKSFYEKSRYTPKITDFGLAKRTDDNSKITTTGQILGTPSYMSPEQASGKVESTNELSDIYSIGAILYAALTGHPPHEKENHLDTILSVIGSDPKHVRDINPKIPRPLAIICHKCLEKDPRNRYQSASELAEDLHRCLNREPIIAKPAGFFSRAWRWSRQRPALAVTLISLVVFFFIYMFDANVLSSRKAVQTPEIEKGTHFVEISILVLVLIWIVIAASFQSLVSSLKYKETLTYIWASLDVVMLTGIIFVARGVESPAIVMYPLLVAGTGLRYRIGLVWIVCGVSIAGYWLLVLNSSWLTAESRVASSQPIYYSLALIIIALIMHLLLWRIQQISSEDR